MKPSNAFIAATVLVAAAALVVFADTSPPWAGLDDVHLNVIPRTEDERARIG